MYSLEHLFSLLTTEKARKLRVRAGRPPVMVLDTERHCLQGPPLSSEEVMQLLRSAASSRQMRELRKRGSVEFVYTLPTRSPFVVRARLENETVAFDVS